MAIESQEDLFAAESPPQLDESEKNPSAEHWQETSTRARACACRSCSGWMRLLSGGSAMYDHRIVSVEHHVLSLPPAADG